MKNKKIKKSLLISVGAISLLSCITLSTTLSLHHNIKKDNQINKTILNKIPLNTSFISKITNNEFIVNNLVFKINSNNEYTVSLMGFNTKTSQPNLIIPNFVTHNNKTYIVTDIAPGAFYTDNLDSVTFNSLLQNIGNYAFANNNLTTLNLPKNLNSIGINSFSGNCFSYETPIVLGVNTIWNKSWQEGSFTSSNNYSKIVHTVQNIIQGNALYQFAPHQQKWIITSYLKNTYYSNDYKIENSPFWSKLKESNSATPSTNYTETTTGIATYSNNLNDYAISYSNSGGSKVGSIHFNTSTMTLQQDGSDNLSGTQTIPGNNIISICSPLKQTINEYNGNKKINNVSFDYGDILGIQTSQVVSYGGGGANGGLSSGSINYGNDIFISSNYINPDSGLNSYMNLKDSLQYQNLLTSYFVIKKSGIYPMQNLTHLTSQYYDANNKTFLISGITLPNKNITININDKTFSTTSNDQGNFSIQEQLQNPLTNNYDFNINVAGVGAFNSHFTGNNPIRSGINLNFANSSNTINLTLLFNGMTNKCLLWNVSNNVYFPEFDNNLNNYPVIASIPSNIQNASLSGNLSIQVGNQTESFNQGTSISTIINKVDNMNYQNGDDVTITSAQYNTIVNMVHSNGNVISFGHDLTNQQLVFKFQVNASGITSLINKNLDQNQAIYSSWGLNIAPSLNSYAVGGNGVTYNANKWYYNLPMYNVGNGFATINNNATYATGWFYKYNWLNPDQSLEQITTNIVSKYNTIYQKASAIASWVHENVKYDFNFNPQAAPYTPYYQTTNNIYNTLSGICVEFSTLTCVMLREAGMVSRVIIGNASINTNLMSRPSSSSDHAWVQVWDPTLKIWMTLDPTWGLYGPAGSLSSFMSIIRSNLSVALVVWPANSNYFSYFKGCEYLALQHLGMVWDIQQNQLGAITYSPIMSSLFTSLFEQGNNLNYGIIKQIVPLSWKGAYYTEGDSSVHHEWTGYSSNSNN